MLQRKQYKSLFLYLLLISFLCFGDHRFTPLSTFMSAGLRYGIHLFFLLVIAANGYLAWNKKDFPWQNGLWVIGYSLAIFIIVVSGAINYFMPLSPVIKSGITFIRVGFANPLPFIVLFVLTVMMAKKK